MAINGRVVTANLPSDVILRLDQVSKSIDRSKSWIVHQALKEWLSEEERRHQLTIEALKEIDEGRGIPHEEIRKWVEQRKHERRSQKAA